MAAFGRTLEVLAEQAMGHEWAWRVLGAFALTLVGLWLCRRLVKVFDRLMGARK